MTSPARDHQRYAESVFLHAVQALPSSEVPAVEAHIAGCAECGRELDALRPVVASFAVWPTEVLRPPASLRKRLAERLAVETGEALPAPPPPQRVDPEWTDVAPGISCKLLATDTDRHRVSMLVRLAPGTDYPAHRHAGVEELYMLHGVLIVDGEQFHPGDYRGAERGTTDRRVWSETGCTCVLVTSIDDAIL